MPAGRGSHQARKALRKAFPALRGIDAFNLPLANVSNQRGKASHNVRPQAVSYPAFEQFPKDLADSVMAVRTLRTIMEGELKMDAEKSKERQDALERMPKITGNGPPRFSANDPAQMVGKTVANVECGEREHPSNVHSGEAMIIHFTDGSVMSIETVGNMSDFVEDEKMSELQYYSGDLYNGSLGPYQVSCEDLP